MKSVLKKLNDAPQQFLSSEFAKLTSARYSDGKWFTYTNNGCVWNVSAKRPVKLFSKFAQRYLTSIVKQLKHAFKVSRNRQLIAHIRSLTELTKRVKDAQSRQFINECIQCIAEIDFQDHGVFWALTDRPGVIGTQNGVIYDTKTAEFITDPGVAKNLFVTKRSGITSDSLDSSFVQWSAIPIEFHRALGYTVLSGFTPRNKLKQRAVLQIAGEHSMDFVQWFIQSVAGDYACCVKSLNCIPKDLRTIRVLFYELNSLSRHVPTLLRQLRNNTMNLLVVLVTRDDKTCLNDMDGYWITGSQESVAPVDESSAPIDSLDATPGTGQSAIQFLVAGHTAYVSNNESIKCNDTDTATPIVSPLSQVQSLLEEFLNEREITRPSAGQPVCRMKVAELTDMIRFRAKKQGFNLLGVYQKDLVKLLRQKNFKIVNPQGTKFFKYNCAEL